jgi:hypothetical protein
MPNIVYSELSSIPLVAMATSSNLKRFLAAKATSPPIKIVVKLFFP